MKAPERDQEHRTARRSRLRTFGLTCGLVFGIVGWIAGAGSLDWLSSHDSGDPRQYVGTIWLMTAFTSFCGSILGLVLVAVRCKSEPIVGKQWLPVACGGSYVLAVVGLGVVSAFA